MTKDQKTENVLSTVREARRWFQREEFVGMVNFIWDGLDGATGVARDPSAAPVLSTDTPVSLTDAESRS
jgi:hypothetical protein